MLKLTLAHVKKTFILESPPKQKVQFHGPEIPLNPNEFPSQRPFNVSFSGVSQWLPGMKVRAESLQVETQQVPASAQQP